MPPHIFHLNVRQSSSIRYHITHNILDAHRPPLDLLCPSPYHHRETHGDTARADPSTRPRHPGRPPRIACALEVPRRLHVDQPVADHLVTQPQLTTPLQYHLVVLIVRSQTYTREEAAGSSHLIVPAVYRQTRVVAHSRHIVHHLLPHGGHKRRMRRVHTARELEVLPDKEAEVYEEQSVEDGPVGSRVEIAHHHTPRKSSRVRTLRHPTAGPCSGSRHAAASARRGSGPA